MKRPNFPTWQLSPRLWRLAEHAKATTDDELMQPFILFSANIRFRAITLLSEIMRRHTCEWHEEANKWKQDLLVTPVSPFGERHTCWPSSFAWGIPCQSYPHAKLGVGVGVGVGAPVGQCGEFNRICGFFFNRGLRGSVHTRVTDGSGVD